jgi:hypothetical protein
LEEALPEVENHTVICHSQRTRKSLAMKVLENCVVVAANHFEVHWVGDHFVDEKTVRTDVLELMDFLKIVVETRPPGTILSSFELVKKYFKGVFLSMNDDRIVQWLDFFEKRGEELSSVCTCGDECFIIFPKGVTMCKREMVFFGVPSIMYYPEGYKFRKAAAKALKSTWMQYVIDLWSISPYGHATRAIAYWSDNLSERKYFSTEPTEDEDRDLFVVLCKMCVSIEWSCRDEVCAINGESIGRVWDVSTPERLWTFVSRNMCQRPNVPMPEISQDGFLAHGKTYPFTREGVEGFHRLDDFYRKIQTSTVPSLQQMAIAKISKSTLLSPVHIEKLICGPRNIPYVKKVLGSNSFRKRLYRKVGPTRPHFVRAYQEGQLSLYLGLEDLSGWQVVVMGTPQDCADKWDFLYSSLTTRSGSIMARAGQIDVADSTGETKYVTGRIAKLRPGEEYESAQFLDSKGFLTFSPSAMSIKIVEEEKGDGSTDPYFRTVLQIWIAPNKQHLIGEVVLPTMSMYGQCVPFFPWVGMPQCVAQAGNITFRMVIQSVLSEYHSDWSDNIFLQDMLEMICANNVRQENKTLKSAVVGSLLPRNNRYYRLFKTREDLFVVPPAESSYPDWFTSNEWYPSSFLGDLGHDYQQDLDADMYDFIALLHGFETFTFTINRFRLRQMVSGRGLSLGGISNLIELENSRDRLEREAYNLARENGMPELMQDEDDHPMRRLD